ncbi:cation diffusion facilitator family transporter [Actimicrobium sp. CCC2.4]|uniref:cation diffusion facilitator family transporter n=1 Tax=Actimicrobium sp. CCC2.4 TaxID=3048606 RepID=UPI002AC9C913|nr:cation diffusion facilitator family transporter [Actimicrobium sp. CCC2.4]MEB0135118.1 cation diffusion facilitator family transporter [Actimicrobium sp. CCC2.4]WPX31837.1 cation diffusion facilitator family transporter [Actimicrobium sp. CCC2.4]
MSSHHHDHAGHDHGHHGHHHAVPANHNAAFAIAIVLNVVFVAVEFAYGFIAQSTALLADAGHNLSDVLGLLLAWGAALLARKQPSGRYTYGLRSSSILAALANALLLLIACAAIAWEALSRFSEPAPVASVTVMVVAGIGIVINGLSAWLFVAGSKDDLNIRGAFLHMAADALVSLAVVVGAAIMLFTGWYLIDALLSLVIVAVILYGTWNLLREAIRLALSAVPANIDLDAVEQFLLALPGVSAVQDLHIWGMSTTEAALTAHLVMHEGHPGDAFMADLSQQLTERYRIAHTTIQIQQQSLGQGCVLHLSD